MMHEQRTLSPGYRDINTYRLGHILPRYGRDSERTYCAAVRKVGDRHRDVARGRAVKRCRDDAQHHARTPRIDRHEEAPRSGLAGHQGLRVVRGPHGLPVNERVRNDALGMVCQHIALHDQPRIRLSIRDQ